VRLGAEHLGDGVTRFLVWAPAARRVELVGEARPDVAMEPVDGDGYFEVVVDDAPPGTTYRYRLDGADEHADPASRWQPEGVHGPSAVAGSHDWGDGAWHGIPVRDLVIYELHVGTFTPEGTFDAAVGRLDDLVDLGITAVELMPVAEFPGSRNWGYDGVLPFAAQSTYGGPDGLRRLVDACHASGLAVLLDVVYNHFGPEGAVQGEFGPYLTDRYSTPWGPALNFDGEGSDGVRRYFIENALWWIDDCHIDGLRLDAVHAILDSSAHHFLAALADAVRDRAERLNRRVHLIAESDLNDPRLVRVPEIGGYGLDAQWSDDFHHALHALVTGESDGYYEDFGTLTDLAVALEDAYVLQGRRSAYRGHAHGAAPTQVPAERFVVCIQNHDQVGNRMEGERLSTLAGTGPLKVAAACVLLSPFLPLLFMGEEYGETDPFLYFVSHTDPDLVEAVRAGRREEFAAFEWAGEPPDPQDEATFSRSVLSWERREEGTHAQLLAWHRRLLELRRTVPALVTLDRDRIETVIDEAERLLAWRRWTPDGDEVVVAVRFAGAEDPRDWALPAGRWMKLLDSCDPAFGGSGTEAPQEIDAVTQTPVPLPADTVVVYRRRS
jgi:maltooligosyltrehalose trehalohydrolase